MPVTEEQRAHEAARLLDDAVFKDILRVLKEETLRSWANSPSTATEKREDQYRDIQALGRLENRLIALRDGLKVAEHKAAQVAKRAALKKPKE